MFAWPAKSAERLQMFGFFKPKASPPQPAVLPVKVPLTAVRLAGCVPVEEHAVDHLCDFLAAVGSIHPLGRASQAAKDLQVIAQAVRALAGRPSAPASANAIDEVFSRYHDYRGKEVTYERLFELAEWILEGASHMGDGGYPPAPRAR